MKKSYAHNDRSQKCFCKREITHYGVLYVSYFIKKYQFSLYWPLNNPWIKVDGIYDTEDRRKTIVTFRVHPSLWMGSSFDDCIFKTIDSVCNEIFTNYINLY